MYYTLFLICSISIVGSAWTNHDTPLLELITPDARHVQLFGTTIVEYDPVHSREAVDKTGERTLISTGGDYYTDVFVIVVDDREAPPAVAWQKSSTMAFHVFGETPGTQARRLRVFDVVYFDAKLWVLYSECAQIRVDVLVQDDEGTWLKDTTIEMFEQQVSEISPRIVRAATFLPRNGGLFVHLTMARVKRTVAIWELSESSAREVHEDSDIFAILDERQREAIE